VKTPGPTQTTSPARPIRRRFESVEPLDVALPLDRKALESLGVRGLQCGCGDAVRRHWLNSDYRPVEDNAGRRSSPGQVFRVDTDRYYLQHNALESFPLEDESVDWCYSEHFIEHLELEQGIAWLAEMRRVLRPGGTVRVSTPDLRKYVEGYLDPAGAFFAEHGRRIAELPEIAEPGAVERRCFMVNQTFKLWGHKWMYDFEELRYAASRAGFPAESVEQRAFRDSPVPELAQLDIPSRGDESVYMEAVKV
jgi:predicted SAM-dependent methyltransferase